eukprot:gb/GFBE01060244.1/.p1 GENE.gb/GFBE01060244.1/~~gb/GFBE01060244.1/.p1  ORF type:complete len:451 (+),score=105.30 gb/GFBE01060244.1/:1-1353(+)
MAGASDPVSPRFTASDVEDDAEDAERKKIISASLDAASKCEGVDVDQRMLAGRKARRGFTMSLGSSAPDMGVSKLRSTKRSQTLSGDIEMSADSKAQLEKMQQHLLSRYRLGSVNVTFDVVPQDVMDETFRTKVRGHQHGLMTEGQQHGDERERVTFGTIPDDPPIFASCQKGCKGFKDTSPNQDNFSITVFNSGYTLVCTFDGHGPSGHIVSTRTVQTVPWYLVNNHGFDRDTIDEASIEGALIDAFEKAQKDVVAHSLENDWDVQLSGSTAVAALFKGNKIWSANAGDSRIAVGTEEDKKVIFETEDHKPQTEKEKQRIEDSGGEVRSQTYPDGWVNYRIFIKGKDYPGLCMARTLGDDCVKQHGVIATPEVACTTVDLSKKAFFVIASDGVWEFLNSSFVVKAVAKKIQSDGPSKTLDKLQREARKRWKAEEGDYCDDITSVLVQLR